MENLMRTEDRLAAKLRGTGKAGVPTLVLMHFLGGSTREWDEVLALLRDQFRIVLLDMPGFGDSGGVTGYSIAEMADALEAAVREHVKGRYILVGHSMSGKVAMVTARRALDRADKRLAGLLLVAPSPPCPEPMSDDKRSMMIGLLGERHEDDRRRARQYITKSELRDIPPEIEERASMEVLRMNRTAWTAWVTKGSREDWAEFVGVLDLPALVVAGDKDNSLGPEQQASFTMHHLSQGKMRVVPNCSHLVPMECPPVMAALLKEFAEKLAIGANVPEEYLRFIASDRVSPRTREVLEARMQTPEVAAGVLSEQQIATLHAMLARVVPQGEAGPEEEPALNLTAYVLDRLTHGNGDGWRYDVLPADAQAYREGLDRLASQGFASRDVAAQDAILNGLAAQKGSADARWFEEVRADAAVAYMAHPATLARIGYSGIGVGGAHTPHQGYITIGPNQREDWEPLPAVETGS
jgi:pimeloyl-ACP methyl ester carboxylesterase